MKLQGLLLGKVRQYWVPVQINRAIQDNKASGLGEKVMSVIAAGFHSRCLGETGEALRQTAGQKGSTQGEAGYAGKRWNDS